MSDSTARQELPEILGADNAVEHAHSNGHSDHLEVVDENDSDQLIFNSPGAAIPRELLASGEPISDIPEFKPEDAAIKIPPTRPSGITEQLRDPVVAAHEFYEAMRSGPTGLGTNEARIIRAIAHRDNWDIAALEEIYQLHYNRNLRSDLSYDLKDSPRILAGIEIALQGDKATSTAALLNLSLTLPGDHRELVNELLALPSPDELIAIRESFSKAYGADIKDALVAKLSGDRLKLSIALLEQNKVDAYAIRLHEVIEIARRDTTPLARLLVGISAEDFIEVHAAFNRIYGKSLVENASANLSEPQVQIVQFMTDGNVAAAQAALLKDSLSGSGDLLIISEILLSSSNILRDAVLASYESLFGESFEQQLDAVSDLPDGSKIFALRVLKNGTIELADYLYRELTGLRLSPGRLVVLFSALALERNQILVEDCAEIYKLNAKKIIHQRLTGATRFDVKMALLGKPDTIDDVVEAANAQHEYDRGGIYGICTRMLDAISPHGANYDRSIAALNQHFHMINKPDRLYTDDRAEQLVKLAQFCEGDRVSYREAKNSLAGFIARSCGLLTAIVTISLVNLILYGKDFGMLAALTVGLLLGMGISSLVSMNLKASSHLGDDIIEDTRRRKEPRRGQRFKGHYKFGYLLHSHS